MNKMLQEALATTADMAGFELDSLRAVIANNEELTAEFNELISIEEAIERADKQCARLEGLLLSNTEVLIGQADDNHIRMFNESVGIIYSDLGLAPYDYETAGLEGIGSVLKKIWEAVKKLVADFKRGFISMWKKLGRSLGIGRSEIEKISKSIDRKATYEVNLDGESAVAAVFGEVTQGDLDAKKPLDSIIAVYLSVISGYMVSVSKNLDGMKSGFEGLVAAYAAAEEPNDSSVRKAYNNYVDIIKKTIDVTEPIFSIKIGGKEFDGRINNETGYLDERCTFGFGGAKIYFSRVDDNENLSDEHIREVTKLKFEQTKLIGEKATQCKFTITGDKLGRTLDTVGRRSREAIDLGDKLAKLASDKSLEKFIEGIVENLGDDKAKVSTVSAMYNNFNTTVASSLTKYIKTYEKGVMAVLDSNSKVEG